MTLWNQEIEATTLATLFGSVSGQTQHLLPYVVGTKEMVIFARRAQWQNGRRFHAGSMESDMLKMVVREWSEGIEC
jgi:hypothetical protein